MSIYPRLPITRKSTGVRMGKGKGRVSEWGFVVRAGRIIFRVSEEVDIETAVAGLRQAMFRIPIRAQIVVNNNNKNQ